MGEKVKCLICNKEFDNLVNAPHIFGKHKLTLKEYKEMFPEAILVTPEYAELRKKAYGEGKGKGCTPFSGKPSKIKTKNLDINLDTKKIDNVEEILDLDIENDEIKTINEEIKIIEVEVPKDKRERPLNHHLVSKQYIIEYLQKKFKGEKILSNQYIEKMTPNGYMIYRVISDITIPSLKLNFEFPKAFWHNKDIEKTVRDNILKNDDWVIIDVDGLAPTIEALEKELNKVITTLY